MTEHVTAPNEELDSCPSHNPKPFVSVSVPVSSFSLASLAVLAHAMLLSITQKPTLCPSTYLPSN